VVYFNNKMGNLDRVLCVFLQVYLFSNQPPAPNAIFKGRRGSDWL